MFTGHESRMFESLMGVKDQADDIVLQNAQNEGVGPVNFEADPEQLHMGGM